MNKEGILQGIEALAREGGVTRDEVVGAYERGVSKEGPSAQAPARRFGIADILYYLGGGIVVLGIGIFLSEHWEELSPFTRILSTLGSGLVAYVLGVLLSKREGGAADWGRAFHLIAAFVLPVGLFVTLDESGTDTSAYGVQSLVYAALTALYFFSHRSFRKNLFAFFGIVFATFLFFALTGWLASGTAVFEEGDFVSYQFLVTGLAYALLGYGFANRPEGVLTRYLYPFGLLFFFGAALSLGGYAPDQNAFWELVFPGLALGAVFLSLPLHSRAFLILGSGFLVAYILKITGEYFADSLGWPLALVLAGFALIGVGTLFVRLNNRYRALA
jgi:hypothetical protein